MTMGTPEPGLRRDTGPWSPRFLPHRGVEWHRLWDLWGLGYLWQMAQEKDAQTLLRTAEAQTATEMALVQI